MTASKQNTVRDFVSYYSLIFPALWAWAGVALYLHVHCVLVAEGHVPALDIAVLLQPGQVPSPSSVTGSHIIIEKSFPHEHYTYTLPYHVVR